MHRARGWSALIVATIACAATVGAAADDGLFGRWGGERLNLFLDANGGRVETDCASGLIAGPVQADRQGHFSATGTFAVQRAGSQPADVDDRAAARYSGDVKGDTMTLTISPVAGAAPQVFHLRKGVAVKLVRCL